MLGTPGRVCAGLADLAPPDLGASPQTPGVCAGLAAPTPPNLGAPPQTPGVCAELGAPAPPDLGAPPQTPGVCAELGAPAPPDAGAPPCTRVTFPSRGKSPKARQGLRPWTRWCRVTALFALAYASRRAGFCHRKRPICHFEMVGESVLLFPLALTKKNILLLIRGTGALVARLGATFGGIRGIGEGGR